MAGTITHSWNGTVLTITSDSGTSSADLKGAQGDTGIRGAQGANGASSAEGLGINNYVVEQGTSGDWAYRKWNSGAVELWCNKTVSVSSSTSATGSLYYSSMISISVPFPITNYVITGTTDNYRFLTNLKYQNASITFNIVSPAAISTTTQPVQIVVYGKWK